MDKSDWNYLHGENFEEYGVDVRSLLWPDTERQRAGFRAFCSSLGMALTNSTVLDVGCGFGDLAVYLHECGYRIRRYVGIDPMPEFIQEARKRCSGMDWVSFRVASLREYTGRALVASRDRSFNYVVALGVLAMKDVLAELLAMMWPRARDAMVFTCLNKTVYEGTLVAYDPDRVLALVQKISPVWKIDASYGVQEFCVTVQHGDVAGKI